MRLLKYILIPVILCIAGCSEPARDDFSGLRIISAAPNVTEILFALGLEENIVGISTHCNYPPETRAKTKIGSFSRPNIERIISLKPDIVFVTGLEQDAVSQKLIKLGIKTRTIYPTTIHELFSAIEQIGRLTDRQKNADILIYTMKHRIDAVRKKVAALPEEKKVKLLIEIMVDPLIVAGKKSFVGELGEIAGGNNIAYDTERAYSKFSPELVIRRNPDCIILGYMFKEEGVVESMNKRLGWSNINAVKNGAIFNDIDPDILLRPGPRAADAVEEIYKRLYEDKG